MEDMLDFSKYHAKEASLSLLVEDLQIEDLYDITNQMINEMLLLIADCNDGDVVFVPEDPDAYDSAAASEEELRMSWTLGHVIVHVTASSEEAAAIAAELARGVTHRGGRSRSEVPWQTIETIEDCRQRLEESRRMRLASLNMWPTNPNLENRVKDHRGDLLNAVGRFAAGLAHDDSHLDQIAKIVRQSKALHRG
jgi:hypothetical protein